MAIGHRRSVLSIAIAIAVAVLLLFVPVSVSVPFIVLHGLGGQCSNPDTWTHLLSNLSGSPGYCVEVGDGACDSLIMPLNEQARLVCETVKQMKELSKGYNIVGVSQGNLVARGLIEFCDGGPPVKNYISLAGPHAGIASLPGCKYDVFCELVAELIKIYFYNDCAQNHIAPSGFVKIPTDIPNYLKYSKYLPKLNNELPESRNCTFKKRFASLQNLVLVMFQDDTVLFPKETSWFGYYPDGKFEDVLPPNKTQLYIEDWIGLKTLDTAGKVKFVSVPGEHVNMTIEDVKKYVVPYLQPQLLKSTS